MVSLLILKSESHYPNITQAQEHSLERYKNILVSAIVAFQTLPSYLNEINILSLPFNDIRTACLCKGNSPSKKKFNISI
jgi:hypothetical protein